jgi:hypothetical protein
MSSALFERFLSAASISGVSNSWRSLSAPDESPAPIDVWKDRYSFPNRDVTPHIVRRFKRKSAQGKEFLLQSVYPYFQHLSNGVGELSFRPSGGAVRG